MPACLDVFCLSRNQQRNENEADQGTENRNEGMQIINILPGNMNVHTKKTSDNVQRDNDGSEEGDLAENLVGLGSLSNTVDRQLGEIVAVGARQDLLEMRQVCHHRNNVILDIAKIHANIHARGDLVILIASLGEAFEHISFATKNAHQPERVFANSPDSPEKRVHIISTRNEHRVFDTLRDQLNSMDSWSERVHNIVTIRIELVSHTACAQRQSRTYIKA